MMVDFGLEIKIKNEQLQLERRSFPRDFARPGIGIPRLLDFFEQRDQFRRVLTLDVVATIIENVDHSIIVQSQNGARIKRKPMLQGDLYTCGSENRGGLLDGHNLIQKAYDENHALSNRPSRSAAVSAAAATKPT